MKRVLFLSIVLLVGGGTALAGIVNGSFEEPVVNPGYLPGWERSLPGGAWTDELGVWRGWTPYDGALFGWLRSPYGGAGTSRLYQTFDASAGDVLTFAYFWNPEDIADSDTVVGTILNLNTGQESQLLMRSASQGSTVGWTRIGYQFTSSGTYTLSFDNYGGTFTYNNQYDTYSYLGIDNVRLVTGVVPVPTAEAGADVTIYDSEQHLTTLYGSGNHTIWGTALQYRWLEAGTVLQDWSAVSADGSANLNLAAVPPLGAGNHILTLEVKDAAQTASDTMTLTIWDRAPEGSGIVNGGFEAEGRYTPLWDVTGWTFHAPGGSNGGTTDDFSLWGVDKNWTPTEGHCFVWMRSSYPGHGTTRLFQTFDASRGDTLSFDYFWVFGPGDPTGTTIAGKLLDKGGTVVSSLFARTLDPSTPWSEWTSVSYTFVASGTYTLSFEACTAVNQVHLGMDNVRLNAGTPPSGTADAGPDVSIYSSEQTQTTIHGSGTCTSPGASLQYRWLEESTVLQDWADVGTEGAADLSLAAPVPSFSVGTHTLTLEIRGAGAAASDTMTLTIRNTPPEAQPAPVYQVVEINLDAIIIIASVADFDGDALDYQWMKGEEELDFGMAHPPAGGAPIDILDLVIPAGDARFPLGENEVQLVVNDGTNPPVTKTVKVKVQDTAAPTLAPTPSTSLLWPPDHKLCPVKIWAHAIDNGGGDVALTASVTSSEPDDGSPERDWQIDSIDNETGTILLQLRAERSGTGSGRVYTVTITATDGSGNRSTAAVDIRVPHDRGKK